MSDDIEAKARKVPERHPSTLIPDETVREMTYRVYLRRLEPPMTPEESRATSRQKMVMGKLYKDDDESRRKHAEAMLPLLREMLRAAVDLGLVVP